MGPCGDNRLGENKLIFHILMNLQLGMGVGHGPGQIYLIYNILLLEELTAAIAHDALSDLNGFSGIKGVA